jgi:hypothetical protein
VQAPARPLAENTRALGRAIDDPKAYARLLDVTVSLQFQDTDLIENVCNDGLMFIAVLPSGLAISVAPARG